MLVCEHEVIMRITLNSLYSILKGKSLINNTAIISNKLPATNCTTDCDTKVDKQFPT